VWSCVGGWVALHLGLAVADEDEDEDQDEDGDENGGEVHGLRRARMTMSSMVRMQRMQVRTMARWCRVVGMVRVHLC
jgi:hypothetical protein